MSDCTKPMVAAKNAVAQPTIATTYIAVGEWVKRTCERATMYTPAVTIVAAWINALTGVGPSIASGSHTYKGSCADLPVAPTKSSRQATVRTPNCPRGSTATSGLEAASNTVVKSN